MKRSLLTMAISAVGILSMANLASAQGNGITVRGDGPILDTRSVGGDGDGRTRTQEGFDRDGKKLPVKPPAQRTTTGQTTGQNPNDGKRLQPIPVVPATWSFATAYHLGANPDPTKRTVQMTFVDPNLKLRLDVIAKEHHGQLIYSHYTAKKYIYIGYSFVK